MKRTLAALGVALALGGAISVLAAAAAGAFADGPTPPPLGALKHGTQAQLTAEAQNLITSSPRLRSQGIDGSTARALTVRSTAVAGAKRSTRNWKLVGGDDAACLVSTDDSFTCGTTAQIEAGATLVVTDATLSGIPRQLSAATLRQIQANGGAPLPSTGAPPTITSGTITGLVPDGYTSVALRDVDGKTLVRAPITDNTYAVSGLAPSDVAEVTLDGPNGTRSASIPK